MTKEKFIDCLRDPSLLHETEIRELHQLVSKYPYFQGARALLAKVSKERKLKDAPTRISSAAVYTTDRALLKKYMSDHLFFLDSRDAAEKEAPATPAPSKPRATPRPPVLPSDKSKSSVTKEAPKPKPSEPKAQISTTAPTPKKNPIKPQEEDKLVDLPESEVPMDDWIREIHEDIEALKKSKARFNELEKKLEEEEAVNAALQRMAASAPAKKKSQEESNTKEEKIKAEEQEAIANNLPLNAPADQVETTPKSEKPAAKEETTAKEEPIIEPDPVPREKEKVVKSYAALKSSRTDSKAKTASNKEENKSEQKAETVETPTPEVTDTESQQEEENDTLKVVRRRSGKVKSTTYEALTPSEEPDERENDQIIDKFISENPKIAKADKSKLDSGKNKEDLADKSSRFQADIGSEYLAEIYVEQGKTERAISIYEKLSLKFPEKKSYFVARIKELKSK